MAVTPYASVFSGLLIYAVGRNDPKRLRTLEGAQAVPRMGTAARRALVALACVPGVALMIAGWWGAFTIWCGATLKLGWLSVLSLNCGPRDGRTGSAQLKVPLQ